MSCSLPYSDPALSGSGANESYHMTRNIITWTIIIITLRHWSLELDSVFPQCREKSSVNILRNISVYDPQTQYGFSFWRKKVWDEKIPNHSNTWKQRSRWTDESMHRIWGRRSPLLWTYSLKSASVNHEPLALFKHKLMCLAICVTDASKCGEFMRHKMAKDSRRRDDTHTHTCCDMHMCTTHADGRHICIRLYLFLRLCFRALTFSDLFVKDGNLPVLLLQDLQELNITTWLWI